MSSMLARAITGPLTGALVLGCCFGPSVPPPVAEPPRVTLSEALTALDSPAPPAPVPAPVVPAPTPSAGCADAQALRDRLRGEIAELRLTVGATRRLDQARALVAACDADLTCLMDGEGRARRQDAVVAAQRALEAETSILTAREVDLFHANEAVRAACGEP